LVPAVIALVAAGVLTVGLGGCGAAEGGTGPAGDSGAAGKLRVVATTTQVADFARNVGGTAITLTQLLKPNVDPHDYEASPADVQAIAGADVVVKSGVGLEKFLDGAIRSAGFTGTVVDSSTGVAVHPGDAADPAGDPHVWHDPRNAKIMARNIADAFAAKDPADRTGFRDRYTAYAAKLDALDRDIQAKIATLP